jgi:hypothetical protein
MRKLISSFVWRVKYELTKCRCNGNPAKCDHKKHPEFISGGWWTSLNFETGEVERGSHSDPSWQCGGCNFPLRPAGGWKR